MEQFSEEIKKALGDWEIVRLLGAGQYGKVYEIQRMDFGTLYRAALKIITIPQSAEELKEIRATGMNDEEISNYFKSVVEDFVREFALMAKLKGHTNIVGYEDHQVIPAESGIGWTILIRMELLTSLINHVSENRITRRDVIKLGIDLCRALELCQRVNVIHRDIKPANIFVSEMGEYKLGDFGVARIVENTMSGRTGTDTYMAPEVYYEEKYGPSADIYSLGIVMYRLLNSNRAPFLPLPPNPVTYRDNAEAFRKRINGEALPAPSQANGRLAEIVLKACAYRAADRYSSPVAMRKDLEAILYEESEAKEIYPEGDGVSDREGLSTNGTVSLKHHKRSVGSEQKEEKQTDKETEKPEEVSADKEMEEQKEEVSPDTEMEEQKKEAPSDIVTEDQKKDAEVPGKDSGEDGEQQRKLNDRNNQKELESYSNEDTRMIRKSSLDKLERKRKKMGEAKPEPEEAKEIKLEESEPERTGEIKAEESEPERTEEIKAEESEPERTEEIKTEEARTKEAEKIKQKETEPQTEEPKEVEVEKPKPEEAKRKETESEEGGKKNPEKPEEEKPKKNKKLIFLLPLAAAAVAGAALFFLKPDTTAAIPNVCGLTYAEAESRLQEEGFAAKLQREYSDAVQKDVVISQDIKEGEEQEKGSVITLTVSDGEEPVPETEEVLVEVPDVRTKKKKAATEELEGMGFTVTVQEEYSNEEVNTVVSQSPEAGAEVQGQQEIFLTVSKKRPDIKGMTCEEALHVLNSEGFEVTEVKGKSSRKEELNTILGADYQIGEKKESVLFLNCIQVPDVSQMKEDEAITALSEAGFSDENVSKESEYNSEVEAGVVFAYQVQEEDWAVLAGIPEGLSLTLAEGQVPQGAKISLTVSRGAKPKENTGSGSSAPATPSYTPPTPAPTPAPQPTPSTPKKEEGAVFSDGDGRVVN